MGHPADGGHTYIFLAQSPPPPPAKNIVGSGVTYRPDPVKIHRLETP
ncbi:hypothetical protein ACIO1C_14390 [Streptomyces sp. NPDC087420]